MAEIPNIGPLRGQFPAELPKLDKGTKKPDGAAEFQDTLKGLVSDVDKMQKTAEESSKRLLTGQVEDVHQVMIAMEEAQTSFQLMMEIRGKILEAYKEVMKMQV
ncbi:MAG: flagellar hook-basal body complex protein FliE [Candidatus Electryonea clarkiae]|nr:flagellar hook-basal body complex protein FliE [Candidatus Electryonea clarkiae]